MEEYIPAVISVVLISSLVIGILLKRKNIIKITGLMSMSVSSIIISLIIPSLYKKLTTVLSIISDEASLVALFIILIFLYVIIILFVSIILSAKIWSRIISKINSRHSILIENKNENKKNKEKEIINISSLSIEECINLAFTHKKNNCLEDALVYYLAALDKKPDRDVVFWLVLDVCTIYKSIGKSELAQIILESYTSDYCNVMDDNVKMQIEKSLLQI